MIIGPDHPYVAGGLPMDAPGVGFGQNDGFAYQARAFLDEVAGIDEADSLPRCATFDEGVHNMEVLAAVTESAAHGGASVDVPAQTEPAPSRWRGAMKFGVYNAILHDRDVSERHQGHCRTSGLTGIELNSGGFLPAVHIPTLDDILTSDAARDDYLGLFEGTGVGIAGLNCNGNPLHPDPEIGVEACRGHPAQHPAGPPAGSGSGRHHVWSPGRRTGRPAT